jgi:hypothetical protein
LVKDIDETSLIRRSFLFSPLFKFFSHKGINVRKEDVMYNYTNKSSMIKSKTRRLFWVAKEVHLVILQALIEVCSPSGSLVVDLSVSIGLFPFLSKIPFYSLYSRSNFKWHFPCKKQHKSMLDPRSPNTSLGAGCGCIWSGHETFGSWSHLWV